MSLGTGPRWQAMPDITKRIECGKYRILGMYIEIMRIDIRIAMVWFLGKNRGGGGGDNSESILKSSVSTPTGQAGFGEQR